MPLGKSYFPVEYARSFQALKYILNETWEIRLEKGLIYNLLYILYFQGL